MVVGLAMILAMTNLHLGTVDEMNETKAGAGIETTTQRMKRRCGTIRADIALEAASVAPAVVRKAVVPIGASRRDKDTL